MYSDKFTGRPLAFEASRIQHSDILSWRLVMVRVPIVRVDMNIRLVLCRIRSLSVTIVLYAFSNLSISFASKLRFSVRKPSPVWKHLSDELAEIGPSRKTRSRRRALPDIAAARCRNRARGAILH